MLHIPPSIIKKTAVFVTAAIIAMALAACKMDMDESTSGGRIVLALDGETVQSLNNAVRTARAEEPPPRIPQPIPPNRASHLHMKAHIWTLRLRAPCKKPRPYRCKKVYPLPLTSCRQVSACR